MMDRAMAIEARRQALQAVDLKAGTNIGLLLHRYLSDQGERDENIAITNLYTAATQISISEVYQTAYNRWKEVIERPSCVWVRGRTAGPLAVGLGSSSVTEVGLALHHTYGLPYVPGSAIKGVCLEAFQTQAGLDPAIGRALFGDQKEAGQCIFHDGWLVPTTERFLHRDTITVHHPKYYGQHGAVLPTDFDDPNPVPFLVVRPGVEFLFAVQAPAPGWRAFVAEMLVYALTRLGLGGKTNAGYGYFTKVASDPVIRTAVEVEREQERITAQIAERKNEIALLKTASDTSRIDAILGRIDQLSGEPTIQRELVEAIRQRLQDIKLWKSANADRKWYKLIEERLTTTKKS